MMLESMPKEHPSRYNVMLGGALCIQPSPFHLSPKEVSRLTDEMSGLAK